MTTPDTKNATGKLWNPLLNFATLPTAGYYLGSNAIGKLREYSVFQWMPPASLSPMDFAVGGAINAAALSGIEYFSGRDGADVDFNKALLITLTLAVTVFAAPHITKATSEWTGVILTTDQMISIAVFNCAAKATTVAAVAFLKYLRDSSIPAIPTSNDDARKITQHQAAYLYDLFKDDTAKWDELPLSVRNILNMRFKENGSDQQLPLKGFKSKVGEEMQKDELQFLFDQAKGSTGFSETERKHLNSLFYEAGLHSGVVVSKETMPDKVGKDLAGFKATDFATLPESTVRWIHHYLSAFPSKSVEADKRAALCDRMIDLKIPTPQHDFYLSDPLAPSKKPTAPKDLSKPAEDEKYLLGWFCAYFLKNKAEFETLSLDERISWSKVFLKELKTLFPMKLTHDEVKGLDGKQTVYFWKFFNDHGSESDTYWATQSVEVQRALNEKFSEDGHTTRNIYPQTEVDVKNMTEKEVRDLNQDFEANAAYVTLLSTDAKEAMKARLHKLGITMAFTTPPEPTLKDRIVENLTVKNIAIGAFTLAGIGLACYFIAPPAIAAIAAKFQGTEPPADDCTHTLKGGESHTLGEKDIVCFSTDLGMHKLTAGDANDFPNGVLATGTKVDLTANNTLCIGEGCETTLTPFVGDVPYSVGPILPQQEPITPLTVTLTDQAPVTLDEGELIQLVHGKANVTVTVGDVLGNHTLVKGDVLSFNEDGNVCVGTGDALCAKTFTSDGEAFVLYTPPEPTTFTAILTNQESVTLGEDRSVTVKHADGDVIISVGDTLGGHTFETGHILSFNEDGNVCVGTAEVPCEKTFTVADATLTPYTPPVDTSAASDLPTIDTEDGTPDSTPSDVKDADMQVHEEIDQQPADLEDGTPDSTPADVKDADKKPSTTSEKQNEEPARETEEVNAK